MAKSKEQLEAERIEAERIEAERVEAERIEAERVESVKLEAERAVAARIAAEAAGPPYSPILLTGIEFVAFASVIEFAREDETFIIFGSDGASIEGAAPVAVAPNQWRVTDGRLIFAGEFELIAGPEARGEVIDVAALAASADGPVLALCEISGGVRLNAGNAYRFGDGSLVFG